LASLFESDLRTAKRAQPGIIEDRDGGVRGTVARDVELGRPRPWG